MDTLSPLSPPPAAPTGEPIRLTWAKPAGMIGLSIANFCLKLATLGFYQFWGKTEVRRRIWSAIRLNGEPLQYTGTGRELLVGFLMVFAAVMLPTLFVFLFAAFAFGPAAPALKVLQAASYLIFLFLYGFAIHRAQRYRLSRTTWRGIRGSVEGSAGRYAWLYFWTGLLVPLTLGWIVPWRTNTLQRRLTADMRFGTRPFTFTGSSSALYARYWVVWIGTIMLALVALMAVGGVLNTSGERQMAGLAALSAAEYIGIAGILLVTWLIYSIITAWYRAKVINHFASATRIEGLRFAGSASGLGLVWLGVTNFALLVAGSAAILTLGGGLILAASRLLPGAAPLEQTLPQLAPMAPLLIVLGFGMLTPLIQARSARYVVERLALSGTLDPASIAQTGDTGSPYGEGAAQAFDLDAF